jgi:cell division septation protein DedD
MPTRDLLAAAAGALILFFSAPCHAQMAVRGTTSAAELAFHRAQQLVADGNGTAGRAIVDSIVAATREGSPEYADALYWRATLAESSDRARLDYLRVATGYALAPRAEDALFRLAQIAIEAGDRPSAKKYLSRMAAEHADGHLRAQGAFWTGRLLLDDGATLPACDALAQAKAKVAAADVELMNQITYYSQPCARAIQQAEAARTDSITRADSVIRADSATRADSVTRAAALATKVKGTRKTVEKSSGHTASKGPAWSAQVAAYTAKEDADRLAAKLTARGYEARVTAEKPYRVRIGRFSSRAGAVELADQLRAVKMTAIVVEAEKP